MKTTDNHICNKIYLQCCGNWMDGGFLMDIQVIEQIKKSPSAISFCLTSNYQKFTLVDDC